MNLAMRGSAAFLGLKYPVTPRLTDFFDMPGFHARLASGRTEDPQPKPEGPNRSPPRPRRGK
jgi:hypothetical protein